MQGKAQLQACFAALHQGVEVIPVWNKSNREHNIIGSEPSQTRRAAKVAVEAMEWARRFPASMGDQESGLIEVRQLYELDDFGPSDSVERFRQLEAARR